VVEDGDAAHNVANLLDAVGEVGGVANHEAAFGNLVATADAIDLA